MDELKIEFEPYEVEPGEKPEDYVVVNDIPDYGSYCYLSVYSGYNIIVYETLVYRELLKYSFNDAGKVIGKLSSTIHESEYPFDLGFICRTMGDVIPGSIELNISLETEEWKKPYTIKEFASALEEASDLIDSDTVLFQRSDDDFVTNGFGLVWAFDADSTMGANETIALAQFSEILKITHEILLQRLDKHELLSYFHFPQEIKVPCTQYLVYFAQFLSDLGIKAEVELTAEDSGNTLFRVLPEDKDTSLSMIKDALDAYLKVGGTDFSKNTTGLNSDIAVMQLQANVMHLQSQLMLANSSIQMKDAAIQSLQLTNYQYQQIVETQKGEEKEDIISGVVSLSKFESNGVSVNLAELLKRLKRKLKF